MMMMMMMQRSLRAFVQDTLCALFRIVVPNGCVKPMEIPVLKRKIQITKLLLDTLSTYISSVCFWDVATATWPWKQWPNTLKNGLISFHDRMDTLTLKRIPVTSVQIPWIHNSASGYLPAKWLKPALWKRQPLKLSANILHWHIPWHISSPALENIPGRHALHVVALARSVTKASNASS